MHVRTRVFGVALALAVTQALAETRIDAFRVLNDRSLVRVVSTSDVYVVLIAATNVQTLLSGTPNLAVVQVPQGGLAEFLIDTTGLVSRTFFYTIRSNSNCDPVDNDADGIDDLIESLLPYLDASNPADAREDEDGDGWDNRTELYLGTNPDDSNSAFGDLSAERARWAPTVPDANFDGATTLAIVDTMGSPLTPTGGGRVGAAWLEMNADAYPDLAAIDPLLDQVSLYRGQASGILQLMTNLPTGAAGPLVVLPGALIGDPSTDLAIGHLDGAVTFFEGDGRGAFTPRPELTVTNLGAIVAMTGADFDTDGDLDLAVSGTDRITVLVNADDPVPAPPVTNGDFAAGLQGWHVDITGAATDAPPGRVSVQAGRAVLEERGAFRVALEQTLRLPPAPTELRFTLADAALATANGQPPDAFEVALRDAAGAPLIPAFRAGAETFFNRSGAAPDRFAPAAAATSGHITLDLAGAPGGTNVLLQFTLIGAPGADSSVAIDDVLVLPDAVYAEQFAPMPLPGAFVAAGGLVACDTDGDGDPDLLAEDGGLGRLLLFTNARGTLARTELFAADYGCPPSPPAPASTATVAQVKFLVADALTWRLHAYAADGTPLPAVVPTADAAIAGFDTAIDNSRTWVVHAGTNDVWVYDANRDPLGRWTPAGLGAVRDVAGAGADLWVYDSFAQFLGGNPGEATNYTTRGRFSRFDGGATRLTDHAFADQQWLLPETTAPAGHIATDDFNLWFLETAARRVHVLSPAGAPVGSWALDPANDAPAGITRFGADLYVADTTDRVVYRYAGATARTSGTASAAPAFALAPDNINPVDLADPATPIALDTPVDGAIGAEGEVDDYVLTISAPTQILAEAVSLLGDGGGFLGLSWRLDGPGGSNVFDAGVDLIGPYALTNAGLYTLAVTSYYNTGSYTFQLRTFAPGAPQPLTSGVFVDGTLGVSNEVDRYSFTLTESAGFYFDEDGAAINPRWQLRGPDGAPVVASSWFDLGVIYLASAGTYTLEVWAPLAELGDYRFAVQLYPAGNPTPVPYDVVMSNTFAAAPGFHAYAFTNGADTQVVFGDMIARSSSSFLWTFLDTSNNVLIEGNLADRGPVRMTQPGTYRLHVMAPSVPGNYAFQLQRYALPAATPIALNATVTGTIATAGAALVYAFDTTNTVRFSAQRVGGPVSSFDWSLADPTGQERFYDLFSNQGPYTLSVTGRHTLVVYSLNGNTGTFTFKLNDIPTQPDTPPTPIAFNTVITNAIPHPYWSNRYSIVVSAPGDVSFDAQSGSFAQLGWRLQDPSGTDLFDVPYFDQAPVTLAAAGTYELIVYNQDGSAPSPYTFEIVAQTQPAPETILLDQEVSNEVAEPYQVRTYHLTLTAGQKVKPDLLLGSSFVLQWNLQGPASNTLFTGGLSSRNAFTATTTGTYRLEIRGYGSSVGIFTFVMRNVPPDPPPQPILFNQIYTPFMIPAQTHAFTFDVPAPRSIFIEVVGNPDPFVVMTLRNPSGSAILGPASGSDFGPFALSATGTHTFLVEGSVYTGSYAFIVWDIPSNAPISIAIGDTVGGAIDVPGETMRYQFHATSGQRVYLESLSDGHPFEVRLLSPAGVELARGNLRDDLDAVTLAADGDYQLEIAYDFSSFEDYVGRYAFQLWGVATHTGGTIRVGDQVIGGIGSPRGRATFTLQGQAGARYYFDHQRRNGDFGREGGQSQDDFAWRLRDPASALVFDSLWRDVGPVTLPASGAYTLEFEGGYASADRLFQFQIWPAAEIPTQALTRGAVVHGVLPAPALTNRYTFTATAGETLVLEAFAGINQVHYTLTDPQGATLFGPGIESLTTAPLATGGTYTVHVTDNFAENPNRRNQFAFMLDAGPLPLPPPLAPNLKLLRITVPPMLVSTAPVMDVVWTVSNASAVAVGNTGWVDRISLNGSSSYGALPNEFLGNAAYHVAPRTGPLAAGATYSVTQSIALPPGTRGVVNAHLHVDVGNAVFESSETDNEIGQEFTYVYPAPRNLTHANAIQLDVADGAHLAQGSTLLLAGEASVLAASENVIFMLDTSGSIFGTNGFDVTDDGAIDALDDLNRDGNPGSGFDLALAAVEAMIATLNVEGSDLEFVVIACASQASAVDPSPVDFFQGYFRPGADANANGVDDFREGLRTLYHHDTLIPFDERTIADAFSFVSMDPGNNLQANVDLVNDLLDVSQPVSRTRVFFIADGGPAADADVDLPTLAQFAAHGIVFNAYQMINPAPVSVAMQRFADVVDAATNASGRARAVSNLREMTAALRATLGVAGVTVNGVGVQALDASGRFFTPYTVQPGTQSVTVACYDTAGNVATRTLTLIGVPPGAPELLSLTDLTGAAEIHYAGATYRTADRRYLVDAAAHNTSAYPLRAPLEARFRDVAPPSAAVANPARFAADGSAVVDLPVTGATLAPGATGNVIDIAFDNPAQARLSMQADIFGPANAPPRFTSTPPLDATAHVPWRYALAAADADGDPVTFAFLAGPTGMTFQAGTLAWTPVPAQAGGHGIHLTAEDDRGGHTAQRFSVLVAAGVSNRPPTFQSAPVTSLPAGTNYLYAPQVQDPDGDALAFQLLAPPPGFGVEPGNGRVTHPAPPSGTFALELAADDGRGGVAVQRFTLSVGLVSTNTAVPLILTTPPTLAVVNALYLYFPFAFDPDGDVLTFSLLQAPSNMTVNASTGQIQWTPGAGQLGSHAVLLKAADPDGAFATQFYTVNVVATAANRPPVITRVPAGVATAGEPYAAWVAAEDPDGDLVTFTLELAPGGMEVGSEDGALAWTPPPGSLGTVTGRVAAVDSLGAAAYATWFIDVRASNTAPVFVTAPVTSTVAGAGYRYAAHATDPEDPVRYRLDAAPAGLDVDPVLGLLAWTPGASDLGVHDIRLAATDDRGAETVQRFTLAVAMDTTPPRVALQLLPAVLEPGQQTEARVSASDARAILTRALDADGTPVMLDGQGIGVFTPLAPGLIPMKASATDSDGNTGTVTELLRVLDASDTNSPVIAITAPSNGVVVTAPRAIIGSVTDPEGHLESYVLAYARAADLERVETPGGFGLVLDNPAFVDFFRGSNAVSNGVLGTFDTTMLPNDDYAIRVTAFDVNGQGRTEGLILGIGGDYKLGQFRLEFTDLELPLGGVPVRITRRYDTFQAHAQGEFGFGWSLALLDPDIRETVPSDTYGTFPIYPLFNGARVYLTNPDGTRVGFTFAPQLETVSFLGAVFSPAFTPDPGVFDTLTTPESGAPTITIDAAGNARMFLIGVAYNPDTYILTRKDGTRYVYSERAGLQRIEDRNGNTISVTATGLVHSAGDVIAFARDDRNRIAAIHAPQGRTLAYAYDAAGDLAGVTDAGGGHAQMSYRSDPPHYLETYSDAFGRAALRTEYDAQGRIVATLDASGNRVEHAYDPAGFTGSRRDGNGHVTTLFYDARGNLVSEVDPLGGVQTFAYDADDNRTRWTDAASNTTTYAYDAAGNKVREVNPLGGTNQFLYDAQNRLVATIDARGATWLYGFDTNGNQVSILNPGGGEVQMAYDARGNLTEMHDVAGGVNRFHYGPDGRLASADSAAGKVSHLQSDAYGNYTSVSNQNGGWVRAAYDAQNRMLQRTNSAGQGTAWTYGALHPSNTVDALGRVTQHTHDNQDRLVRVTDPLGGVVTFGYDGNGNRTNLVDANGNRTAFTFDALNRLVGQADAAGHHAQLAYDAVGNVTSHVDRVGRCRTFEYDALRRRTAENWLIGSSVVRRIEFAYDAVGNLTSVRDPDAQYAFTYDLMGRATRVDNTGSSNAPAIILDYTYDTAGQVTRIADQSGCVASNAYGVQGRLVAQTWSGMGTGGVSVARTFDDCDCAGPGTLRRFADLGGSNLVGTTRMVYDPILGATSLTHSNQTAGVIAAYDYGFNAAGKVTSFAHHGQALALAYDGKDQLVSAADTNGIVESFSYDAAGNPDAAGFVVGTRNTLLAGPRWDYVHDAEGNLVRRTERATGRFHTFAYDHRNRLVRFEDRGATSNLLHTADYRYDPLDRRIAQTVDGVTRVTVYDRIHPWADFDGAGVVTARYWYGVGVDDVLARYRPGEGVAWYLSDRMHTVRDLMNQAGAVIQHIDYTSFGAVAAQTAPADGDRFLFVGREYDAVSGLYQFRHRFYDPEVGRFITQDPLGFSGRDPNLYRYVLNDPYLGLDPFGESLIEYVTIENIQTYLMVCAVVNMVIVAYQYGAQVGAIITTPFNSLNSAMSGGSTYVGNPLSGAQKAFNYDIWTVLRGLFAEVTCGGSQIL